MSSTFLMSYPDRNWQIQGGENFRSRGRAETNPKKAFREWLALCDAILRAGGHILVMPPPEGAALTGMVYTANAGQLFQAEGGWVFLVSKMAVTHRRAERDHVRAFVEKAGIAARDAKHTWEGQADLQLVGGNRFIATWGVRSEQGSLEEVRELLPPSSRVLDLSLREPFFHGDTCLDPLVSRAGDVTLLAHDGAFVTGGTGGGIVAIRRFLGDRVEVLPVEREDAVGYACNALCVNGTVFLPQGLSTSLRGHLSRRGFTCEELAFEELFGKGGGGPRCLANELRGLVVNPGAPDYATLRDELYAKMESYPEKAAPLAGPGTPPSTEQPV